MSTSTPEAGPPGVVDALATTLYDTAKSLAPAPVKGLGGVRLRQVQVATASPLTVYVDGDTTSPVPAGPLDAAGIPAAGTWGWALQNGTDLILLTGGGGGGGGVVKSATITSPVTPIAGAPSETDITGLSISFTADPTHWYRFVCQNNRGIADSVAPELIRIILADGANTHIEESNMTPQVANRAYPFTQISAPVTGLSGTVTRKMRAQRVTGTGTVTWDCAAIATSTLFAEDLGTPQP
jgi:hypothetical protein